MFVDKASLMELSELRICCVESFQMEVSNRKVIQTLLSSLHSWQTLTLMQLDNIYLKFI